MQEEKIYLNKQTNKKNNDGMMIEAYSGHDWGEKLSFTVGVSYVVGK